MPTPWIVEPLDVVKHIGSRLIACAVPRSVRSFHLQRREEALHRGIVPTLALPAHAAGNALIGKQPLEVFGRVLAFFRPKAEAKGFGKRTLNV